ncbi:MAG TPA: hypothetical protein PKA17_11580, partial [Phenylobacterium sp.]|nr:hypothetical protein [Phenylobacterium sp.]
MAVYTAFDVARIQSEPTRVTHGGAALPGEAATLAARLETELAAARGGLAAASAALTSDPESPLEAAELALKTGAGVVEAVAVLDGS